MIRILLSVLLHVRSAIRVESIGVSRRFAFRVIHLPLYIRVHILELHLILLVHLNTAVVA